MRQIITTASHMGQLLRARRKARRLSQGELANRLGISQSRLSTLEVNPGALTLERLMTLTHLLGLELVLEEKSQPGPNAREW